MKLLLFLLCGFVRVSELALEEVSDVLLGNLLLLLVLLFEQLDLVLDLLFLEFVLLSVASASEKKSTLCGLFLILLALVFFNSIGEAAVNFCELVHQLGLLHSDVNFVVDLVRLLLAINLPLFLFLLRPIHVVIDLFVKHAIHGTEGSVDTVVDHIGTHVVQISVIGSLQSIGGSHVYLLLLHGFLSGVGSLLLLNDLLDVHIRKLVLNLCLLHLELVGIELSALSEAILQTVSLFFLLALSLLHHLVIVVELALHQVSQFRAHLCLILGAHGELVEDGLLLIVELFLFLLFKVVKTGFLQLLVLLLNVADLLSLHFIVRVL